MQKSRQMKMRDAAFKTLLRAPEFVLRRLAGGPDQKDGSVLDARVGVMLAAVRALGLQDEPDVAKARAYMERETQTVAPPRVEMAIERDLWVSGQNGDIRARVYTPKTAKIGCGVLVYYHGGGMVAGSIASHDLAVRDLAHHARCIVMSVDYRLAPEHKFPAGPLDALAAYVWARANAKDIGADPGRVGVGGDSAGGNLSAVVTHLAKARGIAQPTLQLLIYPATDLTSSMASHETFAKGYLLDESRVRWYMAHYLVSRAQEREPLASPLFYEHFEGLAPAIVVTAGFDVLRDEGEAYATKLREAGVHVEYTCEPGLIHGFFNMSGVIPAARDATLRMARSVGTALG